MLHAQLWTNGCGQGDGIHRLSGSSTCVGEEGGITLPKLHGLTVRREIISQRKIKIQPQEGERKLDLQKHPVWYPLLTEFVGPVLDSALNCSLTEVVEEALYSPNMSSMASSICLMSLFAEMDICPDALKKYPRWKWAGVICKMTTWLHPTPGWVVYSQVSMKLIWHW